MRSKVLLGLLTPLALLLLLQPVPVQALPPPCTHAVFLTPAYDYSSVPNHTTIGWNDNLCGDSVDYAVGSDSHVFFHHFSLGSPYSSFQSFGAVSQDGNANISRISGSDTTHGYVRFRGWNVTGTFYLTFYYSSAPPTTYVAAPSNTTIGLGSYLTDHTAFLVAPSPAVYWNVTGNALIVKVAHANPVIQFGPFSIPPTNCTSATPWQKLLAGCWFPAVAQWYSIPIGLPLLLGVIIGDIDMALFLKTRNAVIAASFFSVAVGALNIALPGIFNEFAWIMLVMAVTGVLYKLYTLRS